MLRRSEPTFQWDLQPPLLRIYSTTLIDTTAGPSEMQMNFSRTSFCHNRENTHTHTHTHIYIYIYIYRLAFSPISLLHLMLILNSHLPLSPGLYIQPHILHLISLYCFPLLPFSLSLSVSPVFYFKIVHCSLDYFLVS